jgi:hypothetical protein
VNVRQLLIIAVVRMNFGLRLSALPVKKIGVSSFFTVGTAKNELTPIFPRKMN